jgi:UDP-N-acetylmuramate--alanine ligase
MLAELMRLKWSVAIGGTHGKTTTTSLVAAVLEAAKLDPTVINGGIINAYGTNTRLGEGDWMVVEADESDGSFLKLPAVVAVVTNMDPEHLDHWGTADAMKEGYAQFVGNIPFYGFAVLCADHPEVQAMIPRLSDRRIITYGFSPQADVRADRMITDRMGATFEVVVRDRATGAAAPEAAPPADARPAQRAERAGGDRHRARDGHRRAALRSRSPASRA